MRLTTAQERACKIVEGPVLVAAGAGTGKTHTLTRRLVYLIKEKNIKPENILVLTFTNKASQEMRERAEAELGKGTLSGLTLGTFHQLGLKIIRQEIEKVNLNHNFIIYDRTGQERLMKKISLESGKDSNIHELYKKRLREANALDFDDLILLPVSIFKKYPEILRKYQETFTYILVDEYQDIDQPQYELLKLLASFHHNLWAIGDSDQAIYSFRGGNLRNFLDFKKDYPEAELITLEENYRSTEIIVNGGQALIEKNTMRVKKELCAVIKGGVNISLLKVPDEKYEGKAIIKEIERQIGGTSHYELYKSGIYPEEDSRSAQSFSDFAVLYRLHSQGHTLAKTFEESGIPYQVVGQPGKKKINNDPEKMLLQDIDFFDSRADAVTLMTLHAAKGLEFPVVFITGLEDGILPYTPGEQINPEDYEEERRLLYVGMTRAKKKLYLLFAKSRFLFGERKLNPPSPFLAELPECLLDKKELHFNTRSNRERQLSLWKE